MDRVVLAFSKDETADKIKMMLDGSGYDVYTVCHSKAELLRTVSDMDEVLIIMGYKLPDGTVDDVYDDLMEGQKLMSIVKAERQSSIYNQDIFVVTLPLNRQLFNKFRRNFCRNYRKKKAQSKTYTGRRKDNS